MNSTEKFYDELSSQYHLISVGWDEAVRTQGKTLNRLLGSKPLHVLDCSCGIGTQAIGLALEGHQILASDLSSKAISRAQIEASRLNAKLNFAVSDFRELEKHIQGTFEAVISCDNSIPHLLTISDMELAFKSMYSKLKPHGTLLISLRDYDLILKERPSGMPPRKISDEQGTRIYMQTWDWGPDGTTYDLELFLLKLSHKGWSTDSFKTTYRAWQRDEISSILEKSGFKNIEWLFPNDTGYYQPIVRACRAS